MKRQCYLKAVIIAHVALLMGFTSCKSLNGCTEKPTLKEYHYGLLDSLRAGTRAVFESNTGKLDTATYGEIEKKMGNQSLPGSGRCVEQSVNIYYESQNIEFNNKFGFDNFLFIRASDQYMSEGEKRYGYGYKVNDNFYEMARPIKHDLTFSTYNDIATIPIWSKNSYNKIGSFLISKVDGLVQVNYKADSNAKDSIFTFKRFIQ